MALRFDELSPREFEELCLALLHAEGYSTRHVGAAGSEGGWDGRATAPDGRLVCVQCKRESSLTAGKAVKELLKVLDNPEGETPVVWALMASRDLSADFKGKLTTAAGGRCEIQCVGKSDLETRLHAVPRVRDRFFAGDDPKAQIVYLSACKADRDAAAALRRDLQWNLRQLVGSNWNVVWDDPSQSDLPTIPDAASRGIALVSPEALADFRLTELWRTSLRAGSRNGQRTLLALSVAPSVPWPDWLSDDFERLDIGRKPKPYRLDLATIISKWIGATEKDLLSDLSEVEGPGHPAPCLPEKTSRRLTSWLEPLMAKKAMRHYLAIVLGLGLPAALDDFPTAALQASAAVILPRDDDDPIAAALRLIANLQRALDEDESAERLRDLQAIAGELEQERQSQNSATPSSTPKLELLKAIAVWGRHLEENGIEHLQSNESHLRNLVSNALSVLSDKLSITAESTRRGGRTDILIKKGAQPILICECKIWRGPSKLRDAVEQSLGYLTWRDQHIALIIFVRNKSMKEPIELAHDVLKHHVLCRGNVQLDTEGCITADFENPHNRSRTISISVFLFHLLGSSRRR